MKNTEKVKKNSSIKELLMLNIKFLPTIIVTTLLLAIPFVGMQFSDQVAWNLYDFVVAGFLFLIAGFTFETAARKGGSLAYKLAVVGAIGTPLLLLWANLAVGLIGNEDNPANLLYLGVVALVIIGSIISRFRQAGMYKTMILAAIFQMLVPALAYLIFKPDVPVHDWGVIGVFFVSGVFSLLFFASAYLFKISEEKETTSF